MLTDTLRIIKRPRITEKGTAHLQSNVYTFEVASGANKKDIANAVEKAFRVKVLEVRTANCRGRAHRTGRNLSGIQRYKKALVKVAEGQKIKIFEGA